MQVLDFLRLIGTMVSDVENIFEEHSPLKVLV